MIGQSTTSFPLETDSPTMTSITSNPYADHVMEESKTGYSRGSLGAAPATNKGWGIKTGWGYLPRTLNDLLPYRFRPIKSKRRAGVMRWGWGAELYYWRMRWHSHGKYEARKLKNKLQFWKR
jgi:hypothetical protein